MSREGMDMDWGAWLLEDASNKTETEVNWAFSPTGIWLVLSFLLIP